VSNYAAIRGSDIKNPVKLSKHNPEKLLLFALIAASIQRAAANGYSLPDQDAFATARSEAVVATADNPSAIYYNPAGITELKENNLRIGSYGLNYNPSFTAPKQNPINGGKTYNETDNYAVVPNLYYTHTLTNFPFSFGLGAYAPFGGKMNWPQDTGFRSVAISGKLTYITINPVLAMKVLPELSVGAGVMVNYAKMEMNQGLLRFQSPQANFFSFTGDGWSVGYNAGILWQPDPVISLGANFRSSALMNFEGNTDFQLQPRPYFTPQQRNAQVSFDFPLTAVVGLSYRPTPKWNIETDVNYTGWDSFDNATIQQSAPPVSRPFDQNIPINLGWQNSWMYELGITRYLGSGWRVSAGYAFNENSVPNKYYTPLAADMDRHFFSVGAGFMGKIFNFDIAYQFGYGPDHTVSGSNPSTKPSQFSGQNANGTYSFYSHAVSVSAGWHF
jgi:long-chain fatty acid transport protein